MSAHPNDDEHLERQINAACSLVAAAPTNEARRRAFSLMRTLITQRRPQQVARMERARSLRR